MNDEQIKEVMRLADELADACAGCDSSHFALGQRAALEAYLRTIGEPESVNAELLDALKGMVDAHAIPSSYCKERSVYDQARAAIARAESAIETPAKVSPCAGHAVQQDADEVISLAQALEQHRARKIVDAVSALPVGGKHEHLPSPFHAGYQLACEEVMHRLLTEEWDGCMTPPGKQESDDLVGLRGCNSRHGGMRAVEPCIYRMRTTDPGCTGCADRDEDQPTKGED